ncbi:MAG: hypothetical protein A3I11_05635 [Elusimicrobia bacterium RIFCSPLOWO2_02_FULL_39_32]|nr:MAG: hypothetical protein A2034_07225 [Elusimicrobia bacterium GWA2_38_7]OGR80623.1 MAG: hypothetical protein A3B80_03815 [Elusimicrobia bacterium RIFCSPHIGHO2_02_FULL_39_36]OGR91472.1 MAG: hypothetical protein A3I11_05635 [Elusimicrobia bacterium RIFCSPLOWO2_02_FULL_39_32]OGS00727.1 MAG: hypothetical protein A3G85_04235 [Elusimicrobia bacterium RIFCSPLOWO2_12_FULL_39_28]
MSQVATLFSKTKIDYSWSFSDKTRKDTAYITHGYHRYPAKFIPQIVSRLVEKYTNEGDLIVDPMCGSGTTIDVAKEIKRKVIGYDLNIVRPDVIKNDSRAIPLEENSVDFVFIDPPYSDNIKYSNDERCIGKISCEKIEFYDELEKTASEIARILKPDKVMGWVIADQWIKKKFTAVGFLMWQRLEKYFEPMDIVCITRHNQTSNTGVWHNRARQFNFYLRGFKYLFIMKKS